MNNTFQTLISISISLEDNRENSAKPSYYNITILVGFYLRDNMVESVENLQLHSYDKVGGHLWRHRRKNVTSTLLNLSKPFVCLNYSCLLEKFDSQTVESLELQLSYESARLKESCIKNNLVNTECRT